MLAFREDDGIAGINDEYDPMPLSPSGRASEAVPYVTLEDEGEGDAGFGSGTNPAVLDYNTGTLSAARTYLSSVKSFVGAGILGLPYALTKSGSLLGMIGFVLIAYLTLHSCLRLVRCQAYLSNHAKVRTFGDIGLAIYGPPGKAVVEVLLVATQIGFCTGYLLFIAETLGDILPAVSTRAWVAILLPIAFFLSCASSLKVLNPLAVLGVVGITVGTGIVIVYSIYHIGERSEGVDTEYFQWSTLSIYSGIAVSAFEGVGLVIPNRNAMKDNKKYPTILVMLLGTLLVIYSLVGQLGYYAWGSAAKAVILLNLPQSSAGVLVVEIFVAMSVLCSYPLQMMAVTEVMEEGAWYRHKLKEYPRATFYLARVFLVLSTVLLALWVPNFGLLLSFIGSCCATLLGFVIPMTFHLKLFQHKMSQRALLLDVLLLGVSIVMCASGTVSACAAIISEMA